VRIAFAGCLADDRRAGQRRCSTRSSIIRYSNEGGFDHEKAYFGCGRAIALLAAGVVRVELVAQPRPEANSQTGSSASRSAEQAAKMQAMIDAARATYEAQSVAYELGTQVASEVYVWSSDLRSSQVRAAGSRQEVSKACQEHVDRMKKLHKNVAALANQGARGGEADRFHATKFYVAEAELLLLEAQNKEKAAGLAPNP
jgi:hypothetical protein